MFLRRLTIRHRTPELMDQPELNPAEHISALRGLERINRWSFSSKIIWRALQDLTPKDGQPFQFLDIACGAGDVALSLWQKAKRANFPLQITACDISPVAIEYAERKARQLNADISFRLIDALNGELPPNQDAVACSLFLHHLDEDDAIRLLSRMASIGRHVLVNDLSRSRLGYSLAWIVTRLLTRSHIVHVDGPLSVEGAFKPAEALALAKKAGLRGASVSRRWPCRFLLRWSRP